MHTYDVMFNVQCTYSRDTGSNYIWEYFYGLWLFHVCIGADYISDDFKPISSDSLPSEETEKALTKSQKKNMRKKQKKKEAKSDFLFEVEEVIGGFSSLEIKHIEVKETETEEMQSSPIERIESEMLQKRIRALKKKIKQIEDLEVKLSSGECLEKEQLDKISKKESYLEELSKLAL